MSSPEENINLGHHCGNVHTGSEGVEGNLVLVTFGANLLSDNPSLSSVDLSNGELTNTVSVHDNSADLVTTLDLIVNLLQNFLSGFVGGRVGGLEDLLILFVKTVVQGLDTLSADHLGDATGDTLTGLEESLLGCHSLALVPAEEGLNDSMDGSKKDTTLTVDVTAVLVTKGGLEHERTSKSNSPSKSNLVGPSAYILVHTEGGIDSGSVDLLALLVETTDRGSHTLGAHGDHIHVIRERLANGVKVSEQESVAESQHGTLLHLGEDILVQFGLGGI
mmetsp:Transcript_10908/g.16435  ORF Transcript_10908/g.16435 Transcript_10908/m.16435 type:complete len:277 (+) Transcript_10908:474-1304(+)